MEHNLSKKIAHHSTFPRASVMGSASIRTRTSLRMTTGKGHRGHCIAYVCVRTTHPHKYIHTHTHTHTQTHTCTSVNLPHKLSVIFLQTNAISHRCLSITGVTTIKICRPYKSSQPMAFT